MGNLTRKLNRQKPAYTSKPFSQAEYQFVYNKARQELESNFLAKIEEHIHKEVLPKVRADIRKEIAAEITNEAYARFLAVACNILMNDYGKMKNKNTRLKVFYEKLNEYAEEIEKPSQKQFDAEAELARQVDNIEIRR